MTKEQKTETERLMEDIEQCAVRLERAQRELSKAKAMFDNHLCIVVNADAKAGKP